MSFPSGHETARAADRIPGGDGATPPARRAPRGRRSSGGLTAMALTIVASGVAACGGGPADTRPVVASTAPQLDVLLHSLAGDALVVANVVSPTQDIHDIELRPSQVRAIKDAELIVRPGRGTDAWAQEALDAADAKQLDASKTVPGDDRHWWLDPTAVVKAADAIVPALNALDPDGAQQRGEALQQLTAELAAVDRAAVRCLDTIPASRRAIVTDHDAIGAFAQRYGLDVVATVTEGADPEAAPSAQRLVQLLATIKERRAAAIFPIAPHGGELTKTIASRSGITLGRPLWADALPNAAHADIAGHDHGDDASESHVADRGLDTQARKAGALVEAVHENAAAVADALGADPTACGSIITG